MLTETCPVLKRFMSCFTPKAMYMMVPCFMSITASSSVKKYAEVKMEYHLEQPELAILRSCHQDQLEHRLS